MRMNFLRRSPLHLGRRSVIGVPFGWLLLFFLLPFLVVFKVSISEMDGVHFSDLIRYVDGSLSLSIRLSNYFYLGEDKLYAVAYLNSIKYAASTTALCLLLGYPFAYFMARARKSLQPALVMLVMLPFWTSFLLRVYAWKGLLSTGGWIAELVDFLHLGGVLAHLGLIETPGQLMHTPLSLLIGMTYTYLPFMVLPLYAYLCKMDLRLLEAAADLGATPWQAFWRITVPLSMPGIVAGAMLVFIPCIGEYVIPELLGGPSTLMIGRVMWDEFFSNNDWPMASSVAVAMIVLIIVPLALYNRADRQSQGGA